MGQIQPLHESIPQPRSSTTHRFGGEKKHSVTVIGSNVVTSGLNASHSTQGRLRTSASLTLNKYLLSARLLHTEVNYRL